jgi:hypothetical protein
MYTLLFLKFYCIDNFIEDKKEDVG